ncbi:unnamed protein product [Thelazia callipaeda]|uniref:Pre-rRNA-processing protein TSR1 homolog n=1 Tax=Thelazia callipaeda TaxID=103827 RepID=A0A0N5CKQ2_THECL|nr:unnamed protein product [Thelazia callipaeda]
MGSGHRAGPLKQSNKKHKGGRHRSKGFLNKISKGKSGENATSHKCRFAVGKNARRHRTQQLRMKKRNASESNQMTEPYWEQPPIFVMVLSFDKNYLPHEFLGLMCSCDESAQVHPTYGCGMCHVLIKKLKSHYVFTAPLLFCTDVVLNYLKIADVVVFIWPSNCEITTENDILISTLLSYGLPTTMHFVPKLGAVTIPKQKENIRKNVSKMIANWSFGDEKLMECDRTSDGLRTLRLISAVKKKPSPMQKMRPFLVAESISETEIEGDFCTLKVTGYLKGQSLNVNSLIHVPCLGDFQMNKIVIEDDLLLPNKPRHGKRVAGTTFYPNADLQTSLESETVLDPMDAEQTWPVEEEIPKEAFKTAKVIKKVPVGTSTYQAEWIIDEDEEGTDGMEIDDIVRNIEEIGTKHQDSESENELETKSDTHDREDLMEIGDEEIDAEEVEKYRKARENEQFPDEIDTPMDVQARIRFQRYRALKSFRASPWDPLENLPSSYSRIFKFSDYRKSKKIALSAVATEAECSAPKGAFLSLYISKVPVNSINDWPTDTPLVVYGLLAHEHKMSVLNMVLKKHPSCTVPIPNKQKLVFHVGYRYFEAEPVFSQNTNGDKAKMERFMPENRYFVASVFAPIIFLPAPVLVYRIDSRGNHHLVATGSVLDCNPDRVILKRVVLSGHPFKINRRNVVVRYMFFNRDDIEWFKPVELYTQHGRRGHIKEALGTHGHMKCVFDQHLNAMDTVMMNLYKRVFPKWTYSPVTPLHFTQKKRK